MGKPRNNITFSFWSRFYDQVTSFIGFGEIFRRESVQIAGTHQLKEQARVLDVGCGTGTLTIAAATTLKRDSIIFGIDPVPEMLAIARVNALKERLRGGDGIRVSFKLGRIEALPFKDNMFDLVLASMMTHHLDRRLKFSGFREIFRVLKPGGSFINIDFGTSLSGESVQFGSMVKLGAFLYFNVLETLSGNFMLMVKDNFTGLLPPLLSQVGFVNVQFLPSHHKWVVFLRAQKPTNN